MNTSWILVLFILTIVLIILYKIISKIVSDSKTKENHLTTYTQALNKTISDLQEQNKLLHSTINSLKDDLKKFYEIIPSLVEKQVSQFKQNELNNFKEALELSAKQSAMADLESWKIQYEAFYRQDAITRSQSVIMGKVTEHLIPFHSSFRFNPKEARFIGSPIDIIVFSGIDTENYVDIYILEIKTGNSPLNKRQKLIKNAVLNNRVHWEEIRM